MRLNVPKKRIFKVGTPFTRVWHDNPFLTGSLQSLTTLPETKKRKEFLNPFFSKAAIVRVEPSLHRRKLRLFLDTLQQQASSATSTSASPGKEDSSEQQQQGSGVVDFFLGFRCLTADTIMDYCFQQDLNALSEPGFRSETVEAFIAGFDLALVATYFPNFFAVLNGVIFRLSEGVRRKYFAPVYGFQTMQKLAEERLVHLEKNPNCASKTKLPTMFDAMLAPDVAKGQVTPSRHDMIADGCLMIAAGTDTTANVLGTVLWNVTQNPDVEAKLVQELKKGMTDREVVLSSVELEGQGFEYLRAVVKEGLRLAYGVPGTIPRRVPKEGAMLGGRFIPGGTIVSAGIYLQNTDAATFPDPFKFDPQRWLCDAETHAKRDRQMLSFSRGSRACIGINLAYATLHLTVAHLFRRFDIKTTGYTTEHDMEWNDRFVPVPNGRIKGLVKVREE
ncbi:cytochrome P450 [Pleomassaria siparia CBS 279.74]|uniref:Cytochrome P450 n=1 Tax=Pleomassaria siparia CBS 279.74 TaxID=1314801 RepID=A0A6G1K0U8_9PLEO|nr:cytochrome P450 [Pleomassaria siparia CBS 279.74]